MAQVHLYFKWSHGHTFEPRLLLTEGSRDSHVLLGVLETERNIKNQPREKWGFVSYKCLKSHLRKVCLIDSRFLEMVLGKEVYIILFKWFDNFDMKLQTNGISMFSWFL